MLLRGIPGAGKSCLATALREVSGDRFRWLLLDRDILRTSISDQERLRAFLAKHEWAAREPEMGIYRFFLWQTIAGLHGGRNIMWAQPRVRLDLLRLTVDRLHKTFHCTFQLLVVDVEVDPEVAWERVANRVKTGGHGPVRSAFTQMVAAYQSADPDEVPLVRLDGSQPVNDLRERVLCELRQLSLGVR